MTTYKIATEYATQGENSQEWGDPEDRMEAVLGSVSGIKVVGFDAGTVLATGERDVQVYVEAPDTATIDAALEELPPSQRSLWMVTEVRIEEGGE